MLVSTVSAPAAIAHTAPIKSATPPAPPPSTKVDADHDGDDPSGRGKIVNVKA